MSEYDQFSSEELLLVIEEYGRAEAEKERERIIALIELSLDCEFTEYDYLGFRDHSEYCKACELVALIKGEN